jgi:hypothetical protein
MPAAAAAPSAGSGTPAATAASESWTVAIEAPEGGCRKGQAANARIHVAARGGYHVNPDYPMAFRPAADATVDFAGDRVPLAVSTRTPCEGQKEACSLTAMLPFVARAQEQGRVAGTLAFSVCSADRCLIEKVPLALAIALK